MSKFKAGDHVRVIAQTCRHFDQQGVIEEVRADQSAQFHVSGLEPWPLWFEPHELILAEAPAAAEVAA